MNRNVRRKEPNPFEWGRLSRGDVIEVLDHDLVISRGVVDDFTYDRQVIWLQLSYGGGRQMFHQQDGWQLRPALEAPLAQIKAECTHSRPQ